MGIPKGFKHSEETKRKLREYALEHPEHHFVKGQTSPNKGKKHSEETKKKMSDTHMNHLPTNLKPNSGSFKKGMSGNLSPAWKGGTFDDRYIRRMPEYIDWRRQIFIRDEFTCKKCGGKQVYIEVHHITPFIKIIKKNKISNVNSARDCPELWNLENGKTLCLECHNLTKKGRGTR